MCGNGMGRNAGMVDTRIARNGLAGSVDQTKSECIS